MRTTVRLPGDLLERAKRRAAAEGTTLAALIEEGLRLVILRKKSPGNGGKVKRGDTLPMSRHSGGLMPGIDPIKINTQIEDIEDIERMQAIARQK